MAHIPQETVPKSDVSNDGWTPDPLSPQLRQTDGQVTSGIDPMVQSFEVKLRKLAWPKPGDQTLTVD